MLKMLTPKEIVDIWKDLKEVIKVALPPTITDLDESLGFVRNSLVLGKRQAWVSNPEPGKVNAIVITEFVGEEGISERNLLLYAVTKLYPITEEDWNVGIDMIRQFAVKNKCKAVLAYTNQEAVVKLAKEKLGARAEYVLLRWEV